MADQGWSDEDILRAHGYWQDALGRWHMPQVGTRLEGFPEQPPEQLPESQPVDSPAPDATEALLNERGKTHGDFRDHARITQELKGVVYKALRKREIEGRPELTLCQRETLDMIAHKIGRILAGDPNTADHWDDIAGYAKLISREIARG